MAIPQTTTIYGKLLPTGSKAIVNSKITKSIGFKYPIELSPKSGFFSKASGRDLHRSHIRTLLRTERGERFMLPDYGCNLKKYLMEQMDDTTFELIRKEVLESVSKYLRNLSITKLQVFENVPSFAFSKVINVKLFCKIKEEENTSFDVGVNI